MKRPADQAKLLFFALLRSTATALATTGEKSRLVIPQTQNIQLRLATRSDVSSIQKCNLACLPENYNAQFYCSHLRQWPDLALVAEHIDEPPPADKRIKKQSNYRRPFPSFSNQSESESKVVAYLLGKIEARPVLEDASSGQERVVTVGHVTSLAVQKEFRRLGLAKAMMNQLHCHLQHQGVSSCGLHVRTSNEAACRLYEEDGYEISQIIPSYYQDGEDAYFMRKMLEAPLECSDPSRPSALFGRKVWRTGPEEFRLPREHAITKLNSDASLSSDSQSSSSPGLLTGTI